MPVPQPDPQPASSSPPLPAAGSPHTEPEPGGPGLPPTDQDQRPQVPLPACRPLNPGEVVIAAPDRRQLPFPIVLPHWKMLPCCASTAISVNQDSLAEPDLPVLLFLGLVCADRFGYGRQAG
jgi:hypothetical protein